MKETTVIQGLLDEGRGISNQPINPLSRKGTIDALETYLLIDHRFETIESNEQ